GRPVRPGPARLDDERSATPQGLSQQARTGGRPGRGHGSIARRIGQFFESAAIGVDGPDLPSPAAVGHERDPLPIRRPARHTILLDVIGYLAKLGPIGLHDEYVFGLEPSAECDPLAVWRDVGERGLHGALGDGYRLADDGFRGGIESG